MYIFKDGKLGYDQYIISQTGSFSSIDFLNSFKYSNVDKTTSFIGRIKFVENVHKIVQKTRDASRVMVSDPISGKDRIVYFTLLTAMTSLPSTPFS